MDNRAFDIEALLEEMTLPDKIGQMTQVEQGSIGPAEVADLGIGSVLSGGDGNPSPNTPHRWRDLVGSLAEAAAGSRLGVPLLYGVDAVHGHSNVRGATIFPHNIGLGAIGDADLVERIGRATAAEMRATGVRWTFAPTVAVPSDIRWGRTYEGYGSDPGLVSRLGSAAVRGLHGDDRNAVWVLACPKHFVGDGGTTWGTAGPVSWQSWWTGWGDTWQIDQGDTRLTEDELRSIHLAPYAATVEAGALTVMASYSSWNGDKCHGHRVLLTGTLKGELGFDGFVVSDWMGIDQLDPDYDTSVVRAINAGIDMVMVPLDHLRFIEAALGAVNAGRIPMRRIDDAVRRILRAKRALALEVGRAEEPPVGLETVGAAAHRALAADAARRSAVLLKNERVLPVAPAARIEVAGRAADDIGLQCGGWTVGWQGGAGPVTDGTTLVDALKGQHPGEVAYQRDGRFDGEEEADVGIVCIAEMPYAEGPGDAAVPDVLGEDRAVFERMRRRCGRLVLVIFSGRPVLVTDMIERADCVVAAWLPGAELGGFPDLLGGRFPFEGRLPQSWPRHAADLGNGDAAPLFRAGHGLDIPQPIGGPRP